MIRISARQNPDGDAVALSTDNNAVLKQKTGAYYSNTRRFKDTDLFEQIFAHILGQCMDAALADTSHIFVAPHVKACADSRKMQEQTVHDEALWYEDELKKEGFLRSMSMYMMSTMTVTSAQKSTS